MHWQDFVFTIGSIIFIIALFPSVLSKDKPALSTSLMTGSVLVVYAATYFSLSLWFSTITTSAVGITWFILAFQKYKQNKKQR